MGFWWEKKGEKKKKEKTLVKSLNVCNMGPGRAKKGVLFSVVVVVVAVVCFCFCCCLFLFFFKSLPPALCYFSAHQQSDENGDSEERST